jgi:hypothetical protein
MKLTATDILQGQSELITDVIGGYTANQLGRDIHGYGHENDYWNNPNADKPQSSEFFAHYFSAKITGYEIKSTLIYDYFQDSAAFLDKELADVADGLRK